MIISDFFFCTDLHIMLAQKLSEYVLVIKNHNHNLTEI